MSSNKVVVRSKRQMYRLWKIGTFGPQYPVWYTKKEIIESGFVGPVLMRWQNKSMMPISKFAQKEDCLDVFIDGENILNPHLIAKRNLQGELCERAGIGLVLEYTTRHDLMLRDALLANRITVTGLKAKMMLQGAMTPASYDDVREVLDTYPDHVIEFTCCSPSVLSNYRQRNTIIWEVRHY